MKRRRVRDSRRMKLGGGNRQRSNGNFGVEKSESKHAGIAKDRTMSSEKSRESSGSGHMMMGFLFFMVIGVISWVIFAYTIGNNLIWFVVWFICHLYFLKTLHEYAIMASAVADGEKKRGKRFFWEKAIDEVTKALLNYGRANRKGASQEVDGVASTSDDMPDDDEHVCRNLFFMEEDEEDDDGDEREDMSRSQTLEWKIGGRTLSLVRQLTVNELTFFEEAMVHDLLQKISDSPFEKKQFYPMWSVVREKRGITIWTGNSSVLKPSPIRGRMVCAATPAELLSLLIDDERIGEYDNLFDKSILIERLNDRTVVRRSCYRAIWPTRPRDFVIKSTWEEFADGSVVLATHSVDHPDCPESPTYTRGKMFMCGFVIVPRSLEGYPDVQLSSPDSLQIQPSSEITMYAHTDLGGNIPDSILNRLSKKPAYRVLRKIQKMVANRTLVTKPVKKGFVRSMSLVVPQSESLDTLENFLGDRDELNCSQEIVFPANTENTPPPRNDEQNVDRDSPPISTAPAPINRAYALAKAKKIMGALERMASDSAMGWVELLRVEDSPSDGETFLYKCNEPGSSTVHLGACSMTLAAPEELLGLLLESAAMLGPDYMVEKQEVIETLQSEVCSGATSSRRGGTHDGGGDQKEDEDDSTIFWFTCTHKRQRIHRDFVILRCFHSLRDGGGLIAYSSVEHPAFPPSPAYVRGKIELCGFVVVPKPRKGYLDEEVRTMEEKEEPLHNASAPLRVQTDTDEEVERCSSVTYFTCLHFCEYLPAFEDLQVSRHFMGPLHVLAELKRVVKEALYAVDGEEDHGDDIFTDPTCSIPTHNGIQECFLTPRSSHHVGGAKKLTFDGSPSTPVAFEASLMAAFGDESTPSTQSSCSSLVIASPSASSVTVKSMGSTIQSMVSAQKVAQMHEAAVRDLLALASDGEYMGDGPQVDWKLKQDCSDLKLWCSTISECGWRVSTIL